MPKKDAKSSSPKSRRPEWTDPDDAPEITDAALDHATIVKDGKVSQRGSATTPGVS